MSQERIKCTGVSDRFMQLARMSAYHENVIARLRREYILVAAMGRPDRTSSIKKKIAGRLEWNVWTIKKMLRMINRFGDLLQKEGALCEYLWMTNARQKTSLTGGSKTSLTMSYVGTPAKPVNS